MVAEERIWQAVIVSTIEEWMSGPCGAALKLSSFCFAMKTTFA